jgi:protein arginine kinase activator
MQCERCNKKKATVFYRENIGGRVRALRLCGDCADVLEQAGELEDMSTSLTGVLSPLFFADEGGLFLPLHSVTPTRGAARKCPACGATFSELAGSGRMGCETCYTVFSEELAETLRSLHGRAEHRGRVTAGYRARQELSKRLGELREQLKEAVAAEEFERAAGLRDEIRSLEAAL